jgi:hypothetical protein
MDRPRLANIALSLASMLTVMLIVFILVLGHMQFIDGTFYKPVLEDPPELLQTSRCYYRPGEMVWAKLDIKKNRDVLGRVKWNLIDNRLFQFNSRVVSLPAGDYDVWIEVERIPRHLPNRSENEKWFFKGSVEYEINPIKSVVYPLRTTEFEIVDELPEGEKE